MGEDTRQPRFSLFTRDGKKIADGVNHVSCLKPCGELPKKTDWKLPEDFSCEFEIKLTEQNKEQMKVLTDMILDDNIKRLQEFYDKVEKLVEHILRNYVTPPIKGEITRGKVRWRGLQIVWQEYGMEKAFVGVRQRDVLILPNGKKIPWGSLVNLEEE